VTHTPFQLTGSTGGSGALRTQAAAVAVRPLQPIVFAFGRLGDMVVLSAALRLLHQRFGRRCLVIGAGPWNASLFEGHADVERVLSFSRHMPFMLSAAWWHLLVALQRDRSGPIYVYERSPRQLARIRRMLELTGVAAGRCLFIGDVASESESWFDRYVQLGQLTPAAFDPQDYAAAAGKQVPRLHVSDPERQARDAWLQAGGWLGRRLVLLQPGNFRTMSRRREKYRRLNKDDKAWPIENWVALVRKVLGTSADTGVVLCGAPQEGGLLREIETGVASANVVAAELSLRQLLALSESAHSMISVDTGPAHAAAALGLPLVVLFGAESQRVWLPRSSSGSTVLGLGGPPYSQRVDAISLDEVYSAWCSLTR
jgi:ADP-heptose:LPS heptosyltransferase